MRVMCINNKPINGYNLTNNELHKIKEGKCYTVTKFTMTPNGYGKYDLLGVDHDNGFSTLRFIPLSDIDETEFIRNYNLEKV